MTGKRKIRNGLKSMTPWSTYGNLNLMKKRRNVKTGSDVRTWTFAKGGKIKEYEGQQDQGRDWADEEWKWRLQEEAAACEGRRKEVKVKVSSLIDREIEWEVPKREVVWIVGKIETKRADKGTLKNWLDEQNNLNPAVLRNFLQKRGDQQLKIKDWLTPTKNQVWC